jgi:Putative stress-induced transcription regulator/CGNR zinc finger
MPLTHSGRGTGAAVAVDLVNSWDEYPHVQELLDAEFLHRWLSWHGFEQTARQVGDEDVPRARELRARLTSVFDAPDESRAVALLNELVAELGTPPRLELLDHDWRMRSWPDETAGVDAAVAYAAVGLQETIRDAGFERLGRCDGAPCRCVYVDRTRNRARRYCCQWCANRVAQARHRQRERPR